MTIAGTRAVHKVKSTVSTAGTGREEPSRSSVGETAVGRWHRGLVGASRRPTGTRHAASIHGSETASARLVLRRHVGCSVLGASRTPSLRRVFSGLAERPRPVHAGMRAHAVLSPRPRGRRSGFQTDHLTALTSKDQAAGEPTGEAQARHRCRVWRRLEVPAGSERASSMRRS